MSCIVSDDKGMAGSGRDAYLEKFAVWGEKPGDLGSAVDDVKVDFVKTSPAFDSLIPGNSFSTSGTPRYTVTG